MISLKRKRGKRRSKRLKRRVEERSDSLSIVVTTIVALILDNAMCVNVILMYLYALDGA